VKIDAIHHVQITVPPDCEGRARDFYCGVMSLPEIEKPDSLKSRGGFWIQVGPQQLHIGVEDGVDRHLTKAHVAFAVTDLQPWHDRLKDAGIDIVESVPIPDHDRFEFRDPFGNRIEVIAPR